MTSKRENLAPEAAAASERLEEIWIDWKAERKKKKLRASQEQASLDMDWSESMLGQYVRGTRPLNISALMKISRYFSVPPEDVYPELFADIDEVRGKPYPDAVRESVGINYHHVGSKPLEKHAKQSKSDQFFSGKTNKYETANQRYKEDADMLLDLPVEALDRIEPIIKDLHKLYVEKKE